MCVSIQACVWMPTNRHVCTCVSEGVGAGVGCDVGACKQNHASVSKEHTARQCVYLHRCKEEVDVRRLSRANTC
jgi:hypothetical protein